MDTVRTELKTLVKWFDNNRLSINLNKTKYIIFGNKTINKPCQLKIADIEIERVCATKFLGVVIDNKLNWKSHINILKSKISKIVAILYKIKPCVNQNALYILYNSLILPYLNYCVEIWGNNFYKRKQSES